MAKLTLNDVVSGYASATAVNANNTLIETAIENTLSRDGTSPNTMNANIDMNSNRILNLPAPAANNDPVRLIDLSDSDATGAASATLRTDLAASSGSSLVGFIQSGAGATATTTQDELRLRVHVEQFGAVGDGVTDDSAAFQAAFDSLSTTGVVEADAKTYKIVTGFTIGQRQHFRGKGQAATILDFRPGVDNQVCITFTNGAAVCNQSSAKGFTIRGDSTNLNIGIDAQDTSMLELDDIAMSHMVDESIGIRLQGREFTTISRIELGFVDKPIVIMPNINGGSVDCDHLHIRDSYLLSSAGHYHITIAEDVALTNLTIDGTNAWVNGDGGIYWSDTVGVSAALNLKISNVRLESQADSTKYLFYFNRTAASIFNLTFDNIYGGQVAKGFYLRSPRNVHFSNISYINSSNNEALNVDNSVYRMGMINCFWQSGTTATLTNQTRLFSTTSFTGATLPDNGFYEAATGAGAGTGVLLCSGGLKFPATQFPVTDPNTLDDYEEGTWSPTLTTTGTDFTSGGQAGTSGTYTKIGRLVFVRGTCGLSGAVSAGTGNVSITGLPFTAASASIGDLYLIRVTLTGTLGITIASGSGTTACSIEQNVSGAATTPLPASAINGNSDPRITFSLTYQV